MIVISTNAKSMQCQNTRSYRTSGIEPALQAAAKMCLVSSLTVEEFKGKVTEKYFFKRIIDSL